MTAELLSRFRLVLVSPLYAGNVGAVARVAANYDLRDIVVVNPKCSFDPREASSGSEARRYAKGPATAYLEKMRVASSLQEALKDCTAAVGFTRRTGELRRAETTLAGLSTAVTRVSDAQRIALVFGREDAGLTADELLLCTGVCQLTVAGVMPSLNLSHAVAVVVSRIYEDSCASAHAVMDNASIDETTATLGELDSLFAQWRQTMLEVGMTQGVNPDRPLGFIRRALQRGGVTTREVAIFRVFLTKVQAAIGTRRRRS